MANKKSTSANPEWKFSLLKFHIEAIEPYIHHYHEYLLYLDDLVCHIHSKGKRELISGHQEKVRLLNLPKIGKKDVNILRESIRNWIEESPLSLFTPSIIGILSKLYDKRDIPFVRRHLKVYLSSSKHELFGLGQSIIALSNLGERIISEGSYSFNDYQKNIEDAEKYLEKKSDGKSVK
jgi:hypothetical protein